MAAPAFAQEAKQFDIELAARAAYDTNVSRSNEAVAALRGLQREDWILSPTVSVDVVQPLGRQAIFLKGDVGYNFYQENDRLDREKIALKGGAKVNLGPCRSTIGGSFDRRQSDLRDLQLGSIENVESLQGVSMEMGCGRVAGLSANMSVADERADNSSAQRKRSDYQSTNATAGLVYRRATFGELTLFGRVGSTTYKNRLITSGGVTEADGFDSYGLGVNFGRNIGSRLRGSLSIGYMSVDPKTPVGNDFEGITYSADLTVKPSNRLETRLFAERAVKPSNRYQASYSVDRSYNLQAEYAVGSRIKIGLGAGYADRRYESAALRGAPVITEEEVRTVSGTVRFTMSRRLILLLDATQEERDANLHGFDYTANRVSLSATTTF